MLIDEKNIAEEIAKELGIPVEKVTEVTREYKESIKTSIKEFNKEPTEDFKVFMPHLLTFKHK